ncbi:MAG: HAD hydrolase family protein [Pseudomonadales bacterium]
MAQRIAFFLVDLDGCVSEPFTSPNWSLLTQLRELSERSASDSDVPKLSICTGRPAPYTEAVGQWLNVRVPVLFESGAGMLDLATQAVAWHPALPEDALAISAQVKAYIAELKQRYPSIQPEVSKQIDAGFTCADKALMATLHAEFSAHIEAHFPILQVHGTDISVSALWPCANKGEGLSWFCETQGINLAQVAFIGDTSGDLPAITRAGIGFTVSNGNPENQRLADRVSEHPVTAGVIDAWHQLIDYNRSLG